jgi:tripartite-type tricarboxylate transporter receptor subunit TctC
MPLVQAGKLRPLGVTTEKRSPVAPDIPTISEAGLPGYSATSWFSLLAPAATPREVVMRLNQAIVKGPKVEGNDRQLRQHERGCHAVDA